MKVHVAFLIVNLLTPIVITAQVNEELKVAIQEGDETKALNLIEPLKISDDEFSKFDTILYEIKEMDLPKLEVELLMKMGTYSLTNDEPEVAYDFFNRALNLNKEIYDNAGVATCLLQMSRIKARLGVFEEAKTLASRGIHLARTVGNQRLEYQLGNILSWSYFATNYDFNTILEHELNQLGLVGQMDDENAKAGVYNNLAYDYTISGQVELDSLIKLMSYANDFYGRNEGHQGRWYTLMNLTWMYRLKGEYERSGNYGNQSYERAIEINDRHAIIEAALQYGETLLALGRMDEGARYYQEALTQRGDQNDRDSYVFDVYYARFLWTKGDKEAAIQRLEKSLEFLETSEVFYEMHGRAILADFYFQSGDLEKARNQLAYFDNPRSEYIAFESRCIMASTKARLLALEGKVRKAKYLLESYRAQAERIEADHLVNLIRTLIAEIEKR